MKIHFINVNAFGGENIMTETRDKARTDLNRPRPRDLILGAGTLMMINDEVQGCKVPIYPLLNTVYHKPYMIYDRKMMIGYY